MSWKPIERVDWIVIHCAATKPTMDIGVTEIRQWHLKQGWDDVGYHFVVRRNGVVEKGRPLNRPGAHVRGINHCSIGICMVGGLAADGKTAESNFTRAQWNSLRSLVVEMETHFPNAPVIGHRDVPGVAKACPSFDVADWYKETFGNEQESKRQAT